MTDVVEAETRFFKEFRRKKENILKLSLIGIFMTHSLSIGVVLQH